MGLEDEGKRPLGNLVVIIIVKSCMDVMGGTSDLEASCRMSLRAVVVIRRSWSSNMVSEKPFDRIEINYIN